ncbi:hypothetical protein ACS0TY_010129 [Phlomoides rotata]
MTLDEKHNEVITSTSNELAQREADLEVNLNLLNELKVNTCWNPTFVLSYSEQYGFCIN